MILPLILFLAQDVFSGNDGQKPFVKRDPCQEIGSRNCRTVYYDPNDPKGQDNAKKQCFAQQKECGKNGGGCDCWTMPDRPVSVPVIPLRQNRLPAATSLPPQRQYPLNEHFSSGPPPPGRRIYPSDLGPGLTRDVQAGRCQTALHNQRDLYLNCPGYIPDFVNDRLQRDPTAPDPAKPAPIRLYGGVSTTEGGPTPEGANARPSRFGVGNIDEADPPLLVTAKVLQGIDDCLKENLSSDIAMLPLSYAAQRYRGLKSLMAAYGIVGNVGTLIHDLNATLAPGQSLGDASYELGRLLCEGYSLKDVLDAKKNPLVEPEPPGLPPVRPTSPSVVRPTSVPRGPRPTPTYQDPATKSALARGIPLVDHKALQAKAQEKGWNIVVRDSNPLAMKWIGHPNAVAKPMDVKAKTLKPPTPEQQRRMSPAEKLQEKQKEPYYGLASAHGMTSGELSLLRLKGYGVDDPTKGYLLRTPAGKWMYSDIDIHGIYDRAGNDAWPKTPDGERALLDELNDSTLVRMFEHPPQDNFARRNDPTGPSFGPQPPATVYTHDGRNLFVDSVAAMQSAYRELGIDWSRIYP